jgi:serine protease
MSLTMPSLPRPLRPLAIALALALAALAPATAAAAPAAVPGQVVVAATPGNAAALDQAALATGATPVASAGPGTAVLQLAPGQSVHAAIAALRASGAVSYAVPNVRGHAAAFSPNDPGRAHVAGGWRALQWNFLDFDSGGLGALGAWSNLIAAGHPGGRGVIVAVLDTGVAYANRGRFHRSPDFAGTRFVPGYDFVAHTKWPLDRSDGHGTHVAGTIAETTNNRIGVTGLAYGVSIMPVRVLDAGGGGDAATIARGVRWAVSHHAQVINLSIEFPSDVTASDIPELVDAIRYAHRKGVVVVASAGNEGGNRLDLPARVTDTIAVGATTADRCLADYSDHGPGIDVVAPGGGDDAFMPTDPNCHPERANLPNIVQMTYARPGDFTHFGLPTNYEGTSMAAPHVSALAALVIASGVLGRHPTPDQILARIKGTAHDLGPAGPDELYGYGLVDAAAATSRAITAGLPRRRG